MPREAKKLDRDHTAAEWQWHHVEITSNPLHLVLSPWCLESDEKQVSTMGGAGDTREGFPDISKTSLCYRGSSAVGKSSKVKC